MSNLCFPGSNLRFFVLWIAVAWLAASFVQGQVVNQDQEIRVRDLPALMARSHDPADVLLTSLDTVIHDRDVCCGKDSALEDGAERADPKSMSDIAARLQGRHLLSDGRPIMVTAEYVEPSQVNSGHLISMITNQHAPLMLWNSHLYVVSGIVYFWTSNNPGDPPTTVIRKFLLLDTRYSDSRREGTFSREVENPGKIDGFLFLTWTLQ